MATAQKIDTIKPIDRLGQILAVGPVQLPNRVFLAPMSGVTDAPFRRRALDDGAGLVVSEMVASQEFVKGSAESRLRAQTDGLAVRMVQLAGREAHWMGEAAKMLEGAGVDIIDINMGCPAKKVTGGYSGSALMRDLDHAMTLIEATVRAVSAPVTLKMRLGWDDGTINAPELARRAVDAGVQMITVHGRTRCQFYNGSADWAAIRAVRDAVSVPLVVNGDIHDMKSASEALDRSGADAVMIGRAIYGQPWLAGALAKGELALPRDLARYIIAHYRDMIDHYGPTIGLRHARKHLGWYLGRFAQDFDSGSKAQLMTLTDPQEVVRIIADMDLAKSAVTAMRREAA